MLIGVVREVGEGDGDGDEEDLIVIDREEVGTVDGVHGEAG